MMLLYIHFHTLGIGSISDFLGSAKIRVIISVYSVWYILFATITALGKFYA